VEDYVTRTGKYAIAGLLICDDAAKITLIEMGWPRGEQENRYSFEFALFYS